MEPFWQADIRPAKYPLHPKNIMPICRLFPHAGVCDAGRAASRWGTACWASTTPAWTMSGVFRYLRKLFPVPVWRIRIQMANWICIQEFCGVGSTQVKIIKIGEIRCKRCKVEVKNSPFRPNWLKISSWAIMFWLFIKKKSQDEHKDFKNTLIHLLEFYLYGRKKFTGCLIK